MPKTATARAKPPIRRAAKPRAERAAIPRLPPIGASRLVSTSSWLSLARIAGALAGFATQLVLARTLQASALGVFYSVTSLAAVVGLIAAHGYPAIAPRFLSRYRQRGKQALIAAFIARAERDALIYVAIATLGVLALALWPSLGIEARLAIVAAALSIPANAALRLYGSLAIALRRMALAYLPDTCIRPFLLLGGIVALLGVGVTLTASTVTLLLTLVFSVLAFAQYALLREDLPNRATSSAPARLVALWRREAKPLIVVVLVTYLFADIAILMVTPLLPSADTAVIGLCLKLALLVGFAVQVAHHAIVPDLADARARKDQRAVGEAAFRAFLFPLATTLTAMLAVALWGETLLALFGPEFAGAKLPLLVLMACQLARALFGPNVPLLTVIGAQKENAALALATLAVLAAGDLALAPLYGVLGAAVAVTIATLFWLVASAVVLMRLSGLRTDALYLLGRLGASRKARA